MRIQIVCLLLIFTLPLFSQITGFTDDFEDGSLDTTWNGQVYTLWDTEDSTIFHLSEGEGLLRIDYTRTASDRDWPVFFITPPENIDVSVNPEVTLKIKSDVSIQFAFKPIYTNDNNDWEVVDISGNNLWRSFTFKLEESNYSGALLWRIYMHFDGDTQYNKTGTVYFDDFKIAGFSIGVSNLSATVIDSSQIELTWDCNKENATQHYNVYSSSVSGFACDGSTLIGSSTVKTYLDTGLSVDTWYYYKVAAVDAAGVEYAPSSETGSRTYAVGTVPVVEVGSVNSTTVAKYDKFEIILDMEGASWSNPYDPSQVNVYAYFWPPEGDAIRVFGFYDNYQDRNEWKVRFSPDIIGQWEYQIFAIDVDGTGKSARHSFTVIDSDYHGCLNVSPQNPRYLVYHDGTSFYGIGAYYPWGVRNDAAGLGILETSGGNIFGYWNGNYDHAGNGGGGQQIESARTGIGYYDQPKCARIDEILEWAEAGDLKMMFALWPHDVLDETVWGYNGWAENAFKEVCASRDFFSDSQSWAYQEKLYRYIIARWGYSRSLGIWELVNEINGTDGWVYGNAAATLQWIQKVHNYLKQNDYFNRPTTIAKSGGAENYWPEGYSICDMPNVHLYETGWSARYPDDPVRSSYWTYRGVARQFWNDFEKPGIFGEAGAASSSMYANVERGSVGYAEIYHNAIWSSWANGLSMTPVWWEMNDRGLMTDYVFSQLAAFANVAADIDYAHHVLEISSISALDYDAFGLYGEGVGFGWIRKVRGNPGLESLNIENLADGSYKLEWYDTWSGAKIADNYTVSAFAELMDLIPADGYLKPDFAYKVLQVENGTESFCLKLFLTENRLIPHEGSSYTIICALCDAGGRLVAETGQAITFALEGTGTLSSLQESTSNGMARIEYLPSGNLESVAITASSSGLIGDRIRIEFENTLRIDGFEDYANDADLNYSWELSKGPVSSGTLTLENETILEGRNGLKFDYQLGQKNSFIALLKSIDGSNFSGTNYIAFWLKPNDSGNILNIGLREGANRYWMTDYTMTGTAPVLVQIPLQDLSASGASEINFDQVNAFFINITPGTGELGRAETIYIDDINMLFQMVTDVDDRDFSVAPPGYSLSNNYPNPFNAATTIAYSLPKSSNVRIDIYDLQGRLVGTLIDEKKNAGKYTITWNPGNIASGIYFYKIVCDDFCMHRRCMFLK